MSHYNESLIEACWIFKITQYGMFLMETGSKKSKVFKICLCEVLVI